MTREFRLMLAEQGAADPEFAGAGVSAGVQAMRPVSKCSLPNVQCGFPDCVGKSCVEDRSAFLAQARAAGVSATEAMRRSAVAECHARASDWFQLNAPSHSAAALPLPADPRDAEIERLRFALRQIVAIGGLTQFAHIASAALAQSGGAK